MSTKTIGVIVPGYNVGAYGALTLKTIVQASSILESASIIIVAVNDLSTDDTLAAFKSMQGEHSSNPTNNILVRVITHDSRMGFSQALASGLKEILRISPNCDLVVIFPGNDQVDESSISALFYHSNPNTVCLGYRMNKRQERPVLKWLSSEVLQQIAKSLIFPKIKDLTGQFMVPPQFLLLAVKDDPGHAWSVKLSSLIFQSNIPIIQIPIYLKRGFKNRSLKEGFRKYPRARDVAQYISSLIFEFFYLIKNRKLSLVRNRLTTTLEPTFQNDLFE